MVERFIMELLKSLKYCPSLTDMADYLVKSSGKGAKIQGAVHKKLHVYRLLTFERRLEGQSMNFEKFCDDCTVARKPSSYSCSRSKSTKRQVELQRPLIFSYFHFELRNVLGSCASESYFGRN